MRSVVPKSAATIPPQAERVFEGIIFDVYHWQQKMYDGSYETFERLRRPDSVDVIAVKDGKIVVQEELQVDQATAFYDVPGGRHDIETEDELQAAQRELLEETGLRFRIWRLLDVVQPQSKIDWLVYTFLATDIESEVAPTPDVGERITTRLVSFDEAKQLLLSDKGRHCPAPLAQSQSLEELLALPEYSTHE